MNLLKLVSSFSRDLLECSESPKKEDSFPDYDSILQALKRELVNRGIIDARRMGSSLSRFESQDIFALTEFFEKDMPMALHPRDVTWMLDAVGGESWMRELYNRGIEGGEQPLIERERVIEEARKRYGLRIY